MLGINVILSVMLVAFWDLLGVDYWAFHNLQKHAATQLNLQLFRDVEFQ
jgi:hypothetical protein